MKWLSRIRIPSTLVVAVFALLMVGPALAGPDPTQKLVGLWEGVDTLDGSTVRVSIGNLEGNRQLEFRWHESFFSGCFDQGIPEGRGVIAGTVHPFGEDTIELEVTSYVCFDGDNNEVEIDTFSVELDYSAKEDILTRTTAGGFPGFILHRTSSTRGK